MPSPIPAPRTLSSVGVVAILGALVACSERAPPPPVPPRGTPVPTTTMAATDAPELPSKREWFVWHQEGLRYQALARKSEALYCYHRALDAWPKELPPAEQGVRPPNWPPQVDLPPHRAVPLDTLTRLAEVYISMSEPTWAIHYLDVFEQHKEKADGLTRSLRVQAQVLLAPITKGPVRPADALAAKQRAQTNE